MWGIYIVTQDVMYSSFFLGSIADLVSGVDLILNYPVIHQSFVQNLMFFYIVHLILDILIWKLLASF